MMLLMMIKYGAEFHHTGARETGMYEELDVYHTESHRSNTYSMQHYVDNVVIPFMATQRERLGFGSEYPGRCIDHVLYRQLRSGVKDIRVWACNNCRRTSTESDMDTTDPPLSVSRTGNESSIEDPIEESTLEESLIGNPPVSPPPASVFNVACPAPCTGSALCVPCKATVKERDGVFVAGPKQHNHAPNVGAAISAKIAARVKKEAAGGLFKSAAAIVDGVLLDELGDAPCPLLRKPVHLARVANRHRQKLRPEEPKDLDFIIDEDHVPPTFLKGDVRVRVGGTERRHLILTPKLN
ncbi:Hypp6953 [Branchiostoma lanceolatum]|uniref:Hypp6953 protein n=1 Tax=Branchiostoma lanceolatum TaxID=7740 RepID=A0A8J9YVZ4_BRALA|nr:Hypp6953 [Branchiostoma lanceolatum]